MPIRTLAAAATFLLLVAVKLSIADDGLHSGRNARLTITAEQQFAFAEKYFLSGEYYRAIGEYERFLFFFSEDPRQETAMHRIGMAYFRGEQYADAINAFNRLIDRFNDTKLAVNVYLMISECHSRLNQPAQALANLQSLLSLSDDTSIQDEAYCRIGWLHVEMAAWEKARSVFARVSPAGRDKYRLQRLHEELKGNERIQTKSPGAAGFLSILPGAGYAYLGRYRDALTAFLVNGGLIYGAITAFEDDNPALGGVVTFVGSGFYFGNIFGAMSGAHKHNRSQTMSFIERLKANTKIHISADRRRKKVWLAIRYNF